MSKVQPMKSPRVRSHSRLLAGGLAAVLLLGVAARAAEPKTVEQVEAAFAQEKDLRKRAQLALQILDLRFEALRAFVATGTIIEANATLLRQYEAALERLDEAVKAADHAGTSKRVEVGLRRHMQDLEQTRMNVSVDERPLIEALAARVEKLREAVLYAIMAPKKK
jgi:hypothetical protein